VFRFVHTADIHLDSPLLSLALRDPDAAELISNATRQSFAAIIDLCLSEQVDALLIAGDIYDGSYHSMKTAGFLTSQLRRLSDAGIAVFIIRGNHDAMSRITKQLQLPKNVYVFGARHGSVPIENKNVVIHGVSFAKPSSSESLLPGFAPPVAGVVNIGMLHTSLTGAEGHDDYAPCSLSDLVSQGYDYWALGHIHKRKVHAKGPNAVVMPGIPQGRHINEAGLKSVSLVTIDDDGVISIEERQTSLVQFERLPIDVTGVSEWSELAGLAEKALFKAQENIKANSVIFRIELHGQTSLAAKIRRDNDVALEEFRLTAQRAGSIFIESIANNVREPELETKSTTSDPVHELRALMQSDNQISPTVDNQLRSILLALQSKLPPELRDKFGSDDQAIDALLESYLIEGSEDVLARLQASRGEADAD
jgi:exonuclease SbcD